MGFLCCGFGEGCFGWLVDVWLWVWVVFGEEVLLETAES